MVMFSLSLLIEILRSGSRRCLAPVRRGSVLGDGEMVPVRRAREVLADEPGQEQQCAPRSVVANDVLRLPRSVAGDQDDVADRLAADACRVVLEEAVLAVWAGEAEFLALVQRADIDEEASHCLGALHRAVHHRAL